MNHRDYRHAQGYIALLGAIFALAMFPSSAFAATPITGCQTIASAGVYQLQNDITATSTCFTVTASGVTIDGMGHTVTGPNDVFTRGIVGTGVSNISILNISLPLFGRSVFFANGTNVTITNLTADNSFLGISLDQISSSTISSSTITNTQSYSGGELSGSGIQINSSSQVLVRTSTIAANYPRAIFITANSDTVTIRNNTISGLSGVSATSCPGAGTSGCGIDGLIVQDNTFSSVGQAINIFDGVYGALFSGNTINATGNGDADITIDGQSNDNTFINNSITGGTYNSVYIDSASRTIFDGNSIDGSATPFVFSNDSGTVVQNNTLTGDSSGGSYGVQEYNSTDSTFDQNSFTSFDYGAFFQGVEGLLFTDNTFGEIVTAGISLLTSGDYTVTGNTMGVVGDGISVSGSGTGTTRLLEDNEITAGNSVLTFAGVTGITALHNLIRGTTWVTNDTAGNIFNDASTGNSYFTATGTPAWQIYTIYDSDANHYADAGPDLPFSQTVLGAGRWNGLGSDAHPATDVLAPVIATPPSSSGGSRSHSGGSVQSQVSSLTSMGDTAAADALKAQFPTLFPAGSASSAPVSGGICTPYLTSYIRLGAANDPAQVTKLQTFLNSHEGESLAVDGTYKEADAEAVKRFQQKYASEVLGVWGLSAPTGYVYRTTLLKINAFNCAASVSCPYFSEYNSATQNSSSAEIGKTKELLKELGFYSGEVNTTFDPALERSLSSFQETFSATMLKPWGMTSGSGYKYKTTNKFLNMLVGCKTPAVELDGKGSFDY